MVGRHKERNFQKERERAAQSIDRLIGVDAVIGLKHHIALVTLEHFVDVLNTRGHSLVPIMLCSLNGVCAVIQGEQQEIETETQRNDGGAGIPVDNVKGDSVYDLKKQLQRAEQELIDCLQNGHCFLSPVF